MYKLFYVLTWKIVGHPIRNFWNNFKKMLQRWVDLGACVYVIGMLCPMSTTVHFGPAVDGLVCVDVIGILCPMRTTSRLRTHWCACQWTHFHQLLMVHRIIHFQYQIILAVWRHASSPYFISSDRNESVRLKVLCTKIARNIMGHILVKYTWVLLSFAWCESMYELFSRIIFVSFSVCAILL